MRIAQEEARRRGFGAELIQRFDEKNHAFLPSEIEGLCHLIRRLPCPHCGTSGKRLNGTLVMETMSFLIITRHSKKLMIGCADCLDKRMMEANTMSALIGWWGVPWGLIRTPQTLISNIRHKRGHRLVEASEKLLDFVHLNAALLDRHKSDPEKLSQMISLKK